MFGTRQYRVLTLVLCYSVFMARTIRIISVGKAHDAKLADKILEYEQRLKSSVRIEWLFINPKAEATRSLSVASESQYILQNLKEAECVILLDEIGKQYTSPEFSELIGHALASYKNVSIIIGGAYGVDERIKKRANITVSFGKMVMPHQLMRVVLIEQLYRSHMISIGSDYHHD